MLGLVTRHVIAIEGIVQGVGFRPFVYREATARELRGFVRNDAAGVTIEVEGEEAAVADFLSALRRGGPPLATITSIEARTTEPAGYDRFEIVESQAGADRTALVSPDIATCDACLAELFDPADRRYRYPFLNCTDCGPRFTIVRRVPYDRPNTTMRDFVMCSACQREYDDPTDRRFHAQPNACPACGPRLAEVADGGVLAEGEAALGRAVEALRRGRIVAVKGLGGYHLACDATSGAAVTRLRARKHREAKPLAVMVVDLAAARRLCVVDEPAERLLLSAARPIALLRRRSATHGGGGAGVAEEVAEEVAPGSGDLGVMLPYTPLHHLLMEAVARPLVMTSGNRTDEPIAIDDAEAQDRLGPIADLFLAHDRPIEAGCDDSVARIMRQGPAWLRRSRGLAPRPVTLPRPVETPVLGVGAHLKNTFCLAKGGSAFLSHHIGDLENLPAYRALERGIDHLAALFDVDPRVVAHDLHPDYLSTRLALEREAEAHVPVQHHHAHVAACVAEHGQTGPVLGVAFDGTGLGTDGAVWGGEFLIVEGRQFERAAHLGYVPLPGGEGAVRHPDRMAAAHLVAAYDGDPDRIPIPFLERFDPGELGLIRRMLATGVRSPPTSSVGRLFDAVAALAGVCHTARFEGEAAMRLEWAAEPGVTDGYRFALRDGMPTTADAGPVIRGVVEDVRRGERAGVIAARFHAAVASLVGEVADRVRSQTGIRVVALTGGVFQNALLVERTAALLDSGGYRVLLHRRVPCNDGGISFGQVAVAAETERTGG
jgi:hydrogenase maturation protein HypF